MVVRVWMVRLAEMQREAVTESLPERTALMV